MADEDVCQFFRSLRTLAEKRLAEVGEITRRFMEARQSLVPVDREQLLSKVREGSVTVLDVRPLEEFRAGHLQGALSIPLKDLERRLRELPRDTEVVAYCRGPYCVLAIEAVELLRARGIAALGLEVGPADWRAIGLSVALGDESKRDRRSSVVRR